MRSAHFVLLPFLLATAIAQNHGVVAQGGAIRGHGPGYAARFAADGVTFTPAPVGGTEIGALHLRLVSVARGDVPCARIEPEREPTVAGERVSNAHDADVVEHYDVRADGIEQSFAFARRPACSGDLVVTLAVTTDLPLAAASDDEVRFASPGAPGVAFGAVTGIDAAGARMRGGMHCDGRTLRLSLPASFVDDATYPIVLDPLIGAVFGIASSASGSDAQPSVAYDVSSGRYLVVWRIALTAGGSELRGQLVTSSGSLIGNQFLIASGTNDTYVYFTVRAVAGVNAVNRFLVVYHEVRSNPYPGLNSSKLLVRAVTASNAAVSSPVAIYSATANTSTQVNPVVDWAVAGQSSSVLASNDAWVLYTLAASALTHDIYAVRMQTGSSGTPTAAAPILLRNGYLRDVCIAPADATSQRWLVAWVEATTFGNGGVFAQVLGAGGPCGTAIPVLVGSSGSLVGQPTCATRNGSHWLLGWSNQVGTAEDFQVCPLSWSGVCSTGTLTVGTIVTMPAVLTTLRTEPTIEFARDKYVAVWRSKTGANPTRVRLMALHPTTGAPAGAEVALDSNSLTELQPAVASRWSSGDTASDEALAVWVNSNGIRARRYEATSTGTVTSLGGACGIPGFTDLATYSGTPALGTTFSIELLAPTAPVLALIVGLSQAPFACGPCTLMPSLDVLLAGSGPMPIAVPLEPDLIGASLIGQWLQLRPSGCPLLPDYGLSNALQFTIAE